VTTDGKEARDGVVWKTVAKRTLNALGVDGRRAYLRLSAASLEKAITEQGLRPLRDQLRDIVPDLGHQYTAGFDPVEYALYWERNMRGMHAFQVHCLLEAVAHIGREGQTVVDIGDSSGTHPRYLRALAPPGMVARTISVNLDPVAVEKVRASGSEAIHCRAEDLDLGHEPIDLFVSFQMLEHLTDPVRFLRRLAISKNAAPLLVTVPYRRSSRFGGGFFEHAVHLPPERLTAESFHVFELSREDWIRLAWFSGWRLVFDRVYWQYPKRSLLRLTAPLWRAWDFEGFLALFLTPDLSLSNRYAGW
jgi:cyclopropane fatty-acyl-phospholipid synthase-like methyltransferase